MGGIEINNKIKKTRSLSRTDRKILWGLSGGICAKCKEPLIDTLTKTHKAEEAHIIARNDKNLPSYKDLPYDKKDTYENLILLCGTCHEETKLWDEVQLRELKIKHETHVSDTLKGVFKPYEIGKNKFSNYPFVKYQEYQKPFEKEPVLLKIILCFVVSVVFNLGFYFLYSEKNVQFEHYFYLVFVNVGFIFVILALVNDLNKAKPSIHYKGKCTFVGCNGTIHVSQPSLDIRSTYPYLGRCDRDRSHTFTVSNDFKRGNYEKMEIINVTINNQH